MRGKRTIWASLCVVLALMAAMPLLQSCGIYSFTGTSIQPEVKTVTINYFEYLAPKMNPTLSNQMTEALQEKFLKLTKLELVDIDGDLEFIGSITGYDVKTASVTANEQVAQNRLTVTVKVDFINRKFPEENQNGKSFSAYQDFDATQSIDAVEATLCEDIVEQLCEDIFNGTVANW